jgi:hypothetical protein
LIQAALPLMSLSDELFVGQAFYFAGIVQDAANPG